MKPYSFLLVAILCAAGSLSAQDKTPVKFGKITPEDFNIKQSFDTGASAVVIADIGNSVFEGNTKGWFSLVFKHVKRIKILDKKGFDAANIEIALYSNGSGGGEEKLEDLKAYTYNLENGKVVATKLDAASVFTDKVSNHWIHKKFTFPAVKEGSIIEYSYSQKSDFLENLQDWAFQSEYPCLWSEYEVGIPDFFQYVTLSQGYITPQVKTSSYPTSFRVTIPGGADRDETVTQNGTVNTTHWTVKDIPSLKPEGYTSTIKNYISRIEFQLSRVHFQGGMPSDRMGNWFLMGQKMMESENFGGQIAKNNGWLDDGIKLAEKGAGTKLEKAQRIFAYIRDNFTCTAHYAVYMQDGLKEAYKKRNGSVAEINLLLAAMLRHEGINADPVILSTKNHGFTHELYPLMDRFNYTICEAEIDGVVYNLDASSPYNGFGKLPPYCYNGHARVIRKEGALPVYFEADSLKERKMTSVFISNNGNAEMAGSFKSQLGYYESFGLREKLKGSDKDYVKNIKSSYNFDLNIADAAIDSLKQADMPALIRYEFTFKPTAEENLVYFNPMLTEGYKENPFKSADRKYPVEMPYTTDETYLLNMEIPDGYNVEEIPKSAKVAFNDDEGFFEYIIQKNEGSIMLRSRIKINKATFTPEDYEGLREFFGFIVKKQNEQVVFKKK